MRLCRQGEKNLTIDEDNDKVSFITHRHSKRNIPMWHKNTLSGSSSIIGIRCNIRPINDYRC